jgi:tRNA U34 5-methylaminomethyl-2-thiouridine-forming methyltransferase MnmC
MKLKTGKKMFEEALNYDLQAEQQAYPRNARVTVKPGEPGHQKSKEEVRALISGRLHAHEQMVESSVLDAMHVFIRNGLCAVNKNLPSISVLEMGFGTGLNAILTYRENQVLRRHIHYTTVEAYPLPSSVTGKLNYFKYFGSALQPVFREMHASRWLENVSFGDFVLHKIQADMLELQLDGSYDLVYYDAFSPLHQPELWTFEVLHKIYESCKRNAVLVTHCSSANVKRTLKAVGFELETLPGLEGRREMLRAIKGNNCITPCD